MLNVGDTAPDFELASHLGEGKIVKLSELKGENVMIAFYPLDWSPTCTVQMPCYEADKEKFEDFDTKVLGVSIDSIPSHIAWSDSFGGINYDLLSDFNPKGEVARNYGVWRDADGISERAIFLVDKEGKIIFSNVYELGTNPDIGEVFEVLKKM